MPDGFLDRYWSQMNDAHWPWRDRMREDRLLINRQPLLNFRRRVCTTFRHHCEGCGRTFKDGKDGVVPGYMLIDRVWKNATKNWLGYLCHHCILREIGHPIPRRFMVNCQWNRDLRRWLRKSAVVK